MTKSKVKALFISFLLMAVAVCLSVGLAACGSDDESKAGGNYGVGEEGVYYYDKDASTEYLMSLQSGTYMISAEGEKGYAGTYSYDESEKSISFKTDGGENFAASFSDDAMQLAIENTPYTFLKKVNYTVTFVDGNSSFTESVTYGKQATTPEIDDSRIFIGWYEDSSFTTSYKFDTAVTGDLTLYAEYIDIDSTIANYVVSFIADGETIYTTETQNGIVYDIPECSGILGWWVSDTNDGDALTYKYEGQVLNEATKLFAVKEGSLGASVYDDRITWEATVSSVNITIDDTTSFSASGNSQVYDFTALGTGVHDITVSSGNLSQELVYVCNGLARVSNFSVYGNVLVYNAVENAQYYCISVSCGNPLHSHGTVYNGKSLTYDFSTCEMGPDGISFTVYACADGYITSVSDTFVYALVLGGVTVSVNSSTDTATWNAVANATGYEVYVNGEFVETVLGTGYSFKYEEKGAVIKIQVKPVAPGFYSEKSAEVSYTKATLRTPEIIYVSEYGISWDEIADAVGYELNINGYLITVKAADADSKPATTYVLSDTDRENISDKNMNALSVTAIAESASENSQCSDIYYMTDRVMNSVLTYADGMISWSYALAADAYTVEYEGMAETVTGMNSYGITFTHSGENVVNVYFTLDGEKSAAAQINVTTYAVVFDSRGGRAVDTLYVAKGDVVYVETLTEDDYELGMADFMGWYTLPDLSDDENATQYTGGGVECVSGQTFEGSSTLVLYAFWINRQIAVTLHAGSSGEFEDENGNSLGSEIISYISYGSRTYTLPVPVNPDGNTFFIGWYTSETGGIQYADADGNAMVLYNNTDVMNLYAHWGEALAFEITTYNNKTVLSVSKGKDISSYPGGSIKVAETYEVNGVTYPVGVVGSSAFNDCTKLVEINLPDTIMYISTSNGGYVSGSGAFAGCTNLAAVNIYATGVGDEDTTKEIKYYSDGGVLFEKDSTTDELSLMYYPHAKTDSTYTIPSLVGNEAEYAYEGGSVVSVEGHPVTKLNTRVLSADGTTTTNRFKMTAVVIPASVKTVGNQCFYYSVNIERITFLEAGNGVDASLTIEDGAFERCTGLTEITFPSHLSDFNTTMFDYCSALTEINFTSGGKYSSTDGASGTTKGLVCSDGGTCVVYCSRYYTGDVVVAAPIVSIGKDAFNGCMRVTSVTIGASVTLIEESAFQGCTGVESVTFEGNDNSSDLTIKTKAFYGLTNSEFTEITLPCNLVTMEEFAFGNCQNLKTVYFDGRNTGSMYATYELDFATGAFANENGTTYYVTTLYLGANVPYFAFTAVFGTSLSNVYIDEDNLYFGTGEDGVVYNASRTEIYFYPDDLEGAYELPYGLERIGDNVFSKKTNLTGITIPSTVTYIGYQAFYGCTNLAYVTFTTPEEDAAKNLGDDYDGETDLEVQSLVICDRAFYNCSALTTITLPARLTEMGEYDSLGNLVGMDVFTGCNKLETIVVEEGNENFEAEDGILYLVKEGDATDLILSPRKNTAAQGELVIPETVSKIWYRAFYYNEGITKISFENDTAVNGLELDNQITYYSEVEEIVLPYGLETIPYECFYYTRSLTSVCIPYTVTAIDIYAFYGCSSLVTVTFGDVPEELAAEGVEAEALEFGAYAYPTLGGYYFYSTAITELVLPDRTTALYRDAFYGMTKLESVTIGANIEEIPEKCFYNDSKLTTVNFAENGKLKTIGEYAFTNTGALEIVMPDSLETIEDGAFGSESQDYGAAISASAITSVKFNKGLTSIGEKAFYNCKSLATIEFETVTETDYTLELTIGANAFYNSAITEITLPYYVTTISGFYYNLKLTTVNFADTPEDYVFGTEDGHEGHTIVLDDRAFYNCSALTSFTVPWYISSIGEYSLAVNKSMTSVAFDEAKHASLLTDIGTNAFYNDVFSEFTVPCTVETIGATAFSTCTSLSSFTFAADANGYSSLQSIGKNAFLKTAITSFTFPTIDLTKNPDGFDLGEGLFKQCTALTTVTLSNGVKDFGTALSFCYSISEINVGEGSSYKNADDGSPVLYSADGLSIVFTYGEIEGDLVIDEGVMEISDNIFMYQSTMTSVTIPSTVVAIGASAFYGCTSLKSVYFAANTDASKTSALTSLGQYAFAYCSSLEDINLPDSVTSFGTYTFYECTGLKSIEIPTAVELYNYDEDAGYGSSTINSYDFQGCTSLEKVVFRGYPANIGTNAFQGCTSLKTVGLGGTCTEGVIDLSGMSGDNKYFGRNAFSETAAEKVILPATNFESSYATTASTKMYETFMNCTSLTEIVFADDGNSTLCLSMFSGCTALEKVVLNEKVTINAGSSATSASSYGVFANCTSLKTVVTGGAKITAYTFCGCTALTTVAATEEDIVDGVANLTKDVDFSSGNVFRGCSALSFVVLPDECSVPTYMFFGTTSLKTVTNETKYGNSEYLQGVADLSDVTAIATYAFSESGIESLIFPAIKTTDDSGTAIFMNCESLKTITFCEGKITLNKSAFAGCTALETITLRSDMTITAGTANSAANQGVFAGSGLKTVILEGVTSLPNYTFYGCFNLTTMASVTDDDYTKDSENNLVLNETALHQDVIDLTGLTSVGTYEFYGCTSITTVVYPSTMTSTSNYEFSGCTSLTTFAVLTAGEDGTYDFTKIEENIVDLSAVTTMGTYLFQSCESITTVILPESVTTITTYAFDGCTSLVTIGETEGVADLTGVTAMNNYAFQNTGIKELVLGKQTSSNSAQFYECAQLEKVTLTENITIGKAMFAGCSALKEVVTADGATVTATITAGTGGSSASTITNKGAFCDCVSLEKFDVTAAAMNAYTFYNCTSLKEIDLSPYATTGNYAFYGCSALEKVEMPLATTLGTYAFYGCSGLTEVSLPLLTSVPTYEFYGCSSLEKVYIPLATSVGTYAFYGCASLSEITMPALESVPDYVFYGTVALESFDLSSATSVGKYSFYGSGLTTLNIPAALDTIGTAAFGACSSLATITVENGNNVYEERDGFIIDYVNSVIVFAAGGMSDVVTPDGVAEIGEYAFFGFEGDSLTLSDDVTYIGQYAFAYATFGEVTLSKNLETIDSYAFYFTGVEEISIPASVTTIGDYAFSGDGSTSGSAANRVVVINGYSSLKSVTFEEYDADEDVYNVGEQELSIGKYSFVATQLESISLPDRLTEMGEGALLGTTYMTEIEFGTGLTVLPDYVLAGSGITELDIPEWITEIGASGCIYMESLETLTLHEGMETLGQYCFMHAAKLTTVTIPSTCTYIGTYCFSYSDSLESAVYEDGCTTIGVNQVFKNSPNFKSVTLPESLETIPTQCFVGTSVTSIIVPRNVDSIGSTAFDGWDENCYIYLGYLSPYESIRLCGYALKSGSTSDFEAWREKCEGANIYYYSETQPTGDNAFEYWHYDADGLTPVVW